MWSQPSQLRTLHNTPVSHCQTFCKGQATDGSVVGGSAGCRHWQWVHIHGAQLAQRAAPQDCTHHGAETQSPRQLILLSGEEATATHCLFPFPQGENRQCLFYTRGWNYPGLAWNCTSSWSSCTIRVQRTFWLSSGLVTDDSSCNRAHQTEICHWHMRKTIDLISKLCGVRTPRGWAMSRTLGTLLM
jgi:hypothetical protein